MRAAFIFPLLAATLGSAAPQWQPANEALRHRQALGHYRTGQSLMAAESFDEAAREFADAVALDPLLTLAHYRLGQAYMALERYPAAVRAFTGCREAYRSLADLAITNAEAVERRREEEITELGNYVQQLQRGGVRGGNPSIIMQLQLRIQELERTRRRGTPGGFQVPAEISLSLGSAYFRAGALVDADREYRAAIDANPKLGEAHNNFAVVCLLGGRLDEAERELKLAERCGYHVHPQFKEDLRRARQRLRK